jgi:single-strand DNA-binding protein
MNLNTVILSGHLTSEPGATGKGDQVATFTLSFLAPYGSDRAGGATRRDFVSVVAFGKSAEVCHRFLKKGSKVVVDGRLRQDRWSNPVSGEHSRLTLVADRIHFVSALKKAPKPDGDRTDTPPPAAVPALLVPSPAGPPASRPTGERVKQGEIRRGDL